MEANRDLSHQVAQNAEWQQMELEYPQPVTPESLLEAELQQALREGRIDKTTARQVREDFYWRQRSAERPGD